LVFLLSEKFQVTVQRSFGLPLSILAGLVGDTIRNHADSAQRSVEKFGNKLQPILSGKLASSSTAVGATTAHASTFSRTPLRIL
jgi:hypothetical protein